MILPMKLGLSLLVQNFLEILKKIGEGRIHVTVGSALDLFGGTLEFTKVAEICKEQD